MDGKVAEMMEIDDDDATYVIEEHIELNDDSDFAPVEIEEFDEELIDQMNVDLGEFVEATAIKLVDSSKNINSLECEKNDQSLKNKSDLDENQVLSIENEDLLTRRFMNGELTFSEYTMSMNQDIDFDEESETGNTTTNESSVLDNAKSIKVKGHSKTRQKKTRRTLPPALAGLMGEANLRFARGEIEMSKTMCFEIIRQVPSAPEPFQTLSTIYENIDQEKSQQYALIAAHLAPKDVDQWIRLANVSLESGNTKQAIVCYSKAIQSNPKDIELYELRARLQAQNGDKKAYIRAYTKLLTHLEPENDEENIVKYGKLLTELCMQENFHEMALEGLNIIFKKCPDSVTLNEVNQILDILIILKQFLRGLEILIKYTDISIEYENKISNESDSNKSVIIKSCTVPDNIVVDLKAKCIVLLLELNGIEVAKPILADFHKKEDPEESGDLFLDIAEVLMEKKEFEEALKYLESLVNSNKYSLAAVWLRHAECWMGCKDLNKAIKSYEIVTKMSPQHLGAKMEMARIFKLKGQFDKAVDILEQEDMEVLDPGMLFERIKLLYKVRRFDEYFQNGLLLLYRHCERLRSKLELEALSRASGVRQRLDILHRDRLSRGEPITDENITVFSNNNEPTAKQEFLLFLQMCRLACKLKKFGLLQRICFSALTSKKFASENNHMLFLCLVSCIYNNDSFHGFNVVRDMVRCKKNSKTWNLLNIIIQRAEDSRHNRFMMRILGKEDVFSYLHILHANNCLVSGTYKYALNDYISLFKVSPNPLLALLIAITLLQMACQKFAAKKNQLVLQAIAFIKTYMEIRGSECLQESNYNMARCLHQAGLLQGAVHFYKLVLESPVPELIEKNTNLLDLRKEAAFNLHLIYVNSENYDLARNCLENYITI